MIGKAIKSILESNAQISQQVNEMIFPVHDYLGRPNDTIPVIYYIVRARPQTVKNGSTLTDYEADLTVIHNDYHEQWDLAVKIKNHFETIRNQTIQGIYIQHARVMQIADNASPGELLFGTTINIEIKIKSQ